MKRLAIAFSGPSNSGKTTLICKIAKIFIASGLRTAIVKHDPGDKARFDVEGKDSAKFSELGAETVVMSPTRTSYFSQRCMQIDEVVRMLGDFDILLVEGLKTLPLPRISLFRDRIDEAYLPFSDAIASNLSGEQMDKFCRVNFDINDAAGISEWILKNAKKCKGNRMQEIVKSIQNIALQIAEELKYADFGYTDHHNSTGDTQLKLDVKSDAIIEAEFRKNPLVRALISEEKEEALELRKDARLIVAYDPLDGSSLVDVNFAVGSIFGIYEDEISPANLKAAIYCIYGPRLEMVVCEDAPKLYRLNREGKFSFVKDLRLQQEGKLNATGATQKDWSEPHRKLVRTLFDEGYRLRYSGAMVSDLHQILLKGGGLFSYPATSDHPHGKLRVTFEVLPFAFIFERAGGATSDGENGSLLQLKIEKIHQSSPCFFGSKYEIAKMHEIYGEKN